MANDSLEARHRSRLMILSVVFAMFAFQLPQGARAEDSRIQIVRDVAYLGEHRAEKMDLYFPAGKAEKPRPAILIVHGGGWHGGDKAAQREQNIGSNLAAAGYVCASINYRLCRKTDIIADRLREVWPANLQDCRTAVRFLRIKAETYDIDPQHIGAIGGSAGGHLTAMLAVT
ncbi:MAG: alpha/beta hydrolase, partial [Planctomycetota bacterium]|nr:alpha/beta hydrolase [Planctomycetota bacterium]